MDTQGLKQRDPAVKKELGDAVKLGHKLTGDEHPAGPAKHGSAKQALRMVLFGLYFVVCTISIHTTQWLGVGLYFVSRDWYYAWMAVTKQHFGLLITTMTQWWAPTVMRVSGDASVRGQLRKTPSGCLECDFPERLVLLANHQIYTDWVYIWWISYTARMHGHIYIILKESLRYIPFLGPGMMFFSFVFLSRNWVTDKPRFAHRLQKLNARHHGPLSGSHDLDPMWLLIFPEGTNLAPNGRRKSKAWAEKQGIPDLQNVLLPRSTGLLFCLQEMRDTVDYVYDCTIAYEGIPRGEFGQDLFTLRSTYFQGRPPKSVNMHWRRFPMKSIPIDDSEKFAIWLHDRWVEKDDLIEQYHRTGRFPADDGEDTIINGASTKPAKGVGCVETEVRTNRLLEFVQIFIPITCLALVTPLVWRMWHMAMVMFCLR